MNYIFAGVRSFCIDDILSHKTAELQRSKPEQPGIVRPWDQARGQEQEQGVGRQGSRRKSAGDSPLDALFNMASNFEAMKAKSGKKLLYGVPKKLFIICTNAHTVEFLKIVQFCIRSFAKS